MEFTNPEFLWLLLLIPVMAIWYFFVRKKDSADLHMPSIASFEHIVRTENTAKRYLVRGCWKNYRRFCIRCHSYEVSRIRGRWHRCKKCRYDFHDFTGRWINKLRISCREWLWIVKLFELELSARKISQQVDLSYPTVLKALTVLRMAILANMSDYGELLGGEIEIDEAYLGGHRKGKRGRGAAGQVPVFGILERNGRVRMEVVKYVTASTLIDQTVKTVRRGSIVYTDQYGGYDTLMFCGYRHLSLNHKKGLPQARSTSMALRGSGATPRNA